MGRRIVQSFRRKLLARRKHRASEMLQACRRHPVGIGWRSGRDRRPTRAARVVTRDLRVTYA
jgi:hypothetical protein